MGLSSVFRRIDWKRWFLCSNCLTLTSHDAMKSLFYYDGAPELYLGRPLTRCPRCGSTNTRSFQDIKNGGSESALWGLERIVRKHPRSQFEVNDPKR